MRVKANSAIAAAQSGNPRALPRFSGANAPNPAGRLPNWKANKAVAPCFNSPPRRAPARAERVPGGMDAARHILYADDDEHDRFFMCRAFAQLNPPHKLATVHDGVAAMREIQSSVPDLLLLDVKMPHATGFEVLEWVRLQAPPARTVPAIMLSSSPDPRDFATAERLKAIGYFVKPASQRELEAFVVSITHFLDQPPRVRRWKCPSLPKGCRAFAQGTD